MADGSDIGLSGDRRAATHKIPNPKMDANGVLNLPRNQGNHLSHFCSAVRSRWH